MAAGGGGSSVAPMESSTTAPDPGGDLRQQAIESLKKKRDFRTHVLMYVLVNTMLVVIWAVTSGGYFWPVWSIAGWGIGLAAHALESFRRPMTEEAIRREMERGEGTA